MEKHEPSDGREVPGAGVPALDMRPLVRRAESRLLGISPDAERPGGHDHRPRQVKVNGRSTGPLSRRRSVGPPDR